MRAFSDEESDVQSAKLSSAVLEYVQDTVDFPRVAARATLWAETCGSAFYKIAWDEKGGRQVSIDEDGVPVYEGEVRVSALPAFEVFPDRLDAESIDELHSLIHAQIVAPSYVLEAFGVVVEGERQTDKDGALGAYAAYTVEGSVGVKRESDANSQLYN